MEKAVRNQRDKVLRETDERLALIDRQRRDSYLKDRGISMKLNIKSSASSRKEGLDDNDDEDLLEDVDEDLLKTNSIVLEDLENKLSIVSFRDGLLVDQN